MPQPTKRVLCVEDNQDIGVLLYTALRGQGCDAVITYTAGDALMLAGREEFDLFILDTRPGKNPGASDHDKMVAQSLLWDLKSALAGK